jgi:antagonist of KipI
LEERVFPAEWVPDYPSRWRLRVIWGPQEEQFSEASRQAFVSGIFNVSPDSDRTGIRLKGPRLTVNAGLPESIISEGVVAGAVQVPATASPLSCWGKPPPAVIARSPR